MTFLAPMMLLGLLAVVIPPILHLLNRKEAKPVTFPAMEFLRRAYRKTARRLKMKQWLLLALRMALFAALAIALAKPTWLSAQEDLVGLHGTTVKGAQVILFDLSYPMGYELNEDRRETLFDAARAHALRVIAESDGPIAVVTTAGTTQSLTQSLTADRSLLQEAVRHLELSDDKPNFEEALQLAYHLLSERPINEGKQITVLSTPHRDLSVAPPVPENLGELKMIKVKLNGESTSLGSTLVDADDQPRLSPEARAKFANHVITDLKLSAAPHMGRDQWRVEVYIANFSNEPMNLWPIWVELEGEVLVRGFVNLKAQERGVKRLYFKVDPERFNKQSTSKANGEGASPVGEDQKTVAMRAWVKLAPDALKIDDQRPFWIESRPPISLLALNGDPRPTPHEDELFYLERALGPAVLGDTPVTLRSRPLLSAELTDQELEGVDLILLANLPRPSVSLGEQLKSHLEAGGGLWLAPGARSDVEAWNRALGDLLPRTLRGQRKAGDAASVEGRSVARLSDFKPHRLLSAFESPERSSLALAQIHQYFLFDPKPTSRAETVITLDEGSPFVMTQQFGQGRVVLWAGPLDREWSDLVIRPDFVPLAAETVRYLSRDQSGTSLSAPLNGRVQLELNGEGPFYSISPLGEKSILTRSEQSKGGLSGGTHQTRGWQSVALKRIGHYQITSSRELINRGKEDQNDHVERALRRFVVHLEISESDLQERGASEMTQNERSAGTTVEVSALGQRRELWHIGLIGLFLFTLLEGLTLYQRREEARVH